MRHLKSIGILAAIVCVSAIIALASAARATPQPSIDAYGNVRVVAPLVVTDSGIGIANGSGSVAGVVTTGTQTFAGAKTFASITTSNGTTIGTAGTAITASPRCTDTLATSAIAANTTATQDITCAAAAAAGECVVGGPATLEAGLIQTCIVPSAGVVRLRTHNGTVGSITPAAAQTVAVRVFNP